MYLPCGVFNENYRTDMRVVRHREHWFLGLVVALVLLYLILFANDYYLGLANLIGITLISAFGLQILTGFAGQLSIAQAAFMAVGAYASAILTEDIGLSFWLAVPCASLCAGLAGILFGWPSLRIKGFYLIMATFAAQFIIMYFIGTTFSRWTGGYGGHVAPPPNFFGYEIDNERSWFVLIFILVIVGNFFFLNMKRTKMGRAFVALRDNDLAAEVTGLNLARYKLAAFFLCCLYAGVAGALYAHWQQIVMPEGFSLDKSMFYLGYLIVGGVGSIPGVYFGVIIIILLEELLVVGIGSLSATYPAASSYIAPAQNIVFGLVIVLFLVFEPRGLAHRWEVFKTYYRSWPFPYVATQK
ncbi:MAG: branched-chain amino acid ABC transporter permease [Proteobacteria bacterium]|nr:branched-chain amino acid ABC transporter permease [Pseudomonadota bacterium]